MPFPLYDVSFPCKSILKGCVWVCWLKKGARQRILGRGKKCAEVWKYKEDRSGDHLWGALCAVLGIGFGLVSGGEPLKDLKDWEESHNHICFWEKKSHGQWFWVDWRATASEMGTIGDGLRKRRWGLERGERGVEWRHRHQTRFVVGRIGFDDHCLREGVRSWGWRTVPRLRGW